MKDSLFVSLSSPESGEEEDEQPGVKEDTGEETEGADAEKKESQGESRLKTEEQYENQTYTILFFFFLPSFPGSRSPQICITKLYIHVFLFFQAKDLFLF